ncbi:CheF family chemotaxis protein [Archaeoglobus neptunius]|uniref:CheF family chemotaxis protein n=1 Tax=Archaeoglobus neptunius TaxID=2798580 RepID=UPI001927413F|nr:CheF family chemotaxis protein [Archaeoglobus neptunius]
MSENKELRIPVEYFDNGWKKGEATISKTAISFAGLTIPFKEIQDLEKLNFEGKEAIRIKKDGNYYLHFGNRQDQIFRYLAFNLKSDRFAVYFLSPATRGGVVVSDSKWDKGYLSITDEALWFLSTSRQIRISIENLGSVGKDVRTVGKKQRVVLVITHVENGEVITSFVLCPETTMDMLQEYIKNIIDRHKPNEDLSEIEEQILTMVYTGVDSVSVESILGITTEELNKLYDRLVNLGLARVVKIRKEIELTPRGVALVSDIMKKAAR